ncbi:MULTISPECIES: VTT domain-containing protein [unclassified Caballeronia]|uniref:bifunctional DedA family/phosphatase PAP2 family protein n=1 Tax=unclassified Caballeronia TaxID=2646786 RepID=UPI00285F2DB7|nr:MULTISPECIES: VTT domain-containing protein [unclassified Caballeronia]MDR5739194.1 VTT domain-containing protein [Caballeronia sp. LZ016]MDR5807683.1 VTT domain-containing protein [Caballeronia sp. LZ019]
MEHAYYQLLHLMSAHPEWALAVVLLASFLESLAFVGTFVPGSTAMFVAGALVGAGALNLGWVLVCAILGAIAGDAVSFWFGARYADTLAQMWPFRRHPGALAAGKRYFEAHGAKSVVLARFVGPMRAVVPVVAGISGMPPARFFVVNVVSALIWAPLHVLPGVVFGASIELAGAVSIRLVVILVAVTALAWLVFNLARVVVWHAKEWTVASREWLLTWAERKPGVTARVVSRALDPGNPATGLIAVISVLLLASAVLFFYVLTNVTRGSSLVQVDASIYRLLQSFRSTWADSILDAAAALGSMPTLLALAAMVIVWMILERRWRTVAYWLVAVVFSQVLVAVIRFTTHQPLPMSFAPAGRTFPSSHLAATVVIYGFLAFLLLRRVGMLTGVFVATAASGIVTAVALAGLYFGRFTISDALGSAALAAIWVFLIALTAVWRNPGKPKPRPLMPLAVLTVVCASVALQVSDDTEAHSKPPATVVVTPIEWMDTVWRRFSCYRSSLDGDRLEPITVQWAATPAQIRAQLASRGWKEVTGVTMQSVMSVVSPDAPATALPALPRLNNGEPSKLVFTRSPRGPDQRDVLRFWPTTYAVREHSGAAPTPIWLGSIVHERLRRPSWPFNVLRPDRRMDPMAIDHGDASPWRGIEIASSAGCGSVPVMLVESRPK